MHHSSRLFIARGAVLAALVVALGAAASHARADRLREQEIATCPAGEISTWPDGRDRPAGVRHLRIAYLHAGAPGWFPAAETTAMVRRAAEAWSECGIAIEVSTEQPAADHVVIEWSAEGSRGNFGLTDLRNRRLSLGPQTFALLRNRNPAHDARETLQMTLSHEMGHFLGLMAHSRRCIDVLSYYDDGKGNRCFSRHPAATAAGKDYRHILPTACDIARCRRVNGLTP